MPYSNDEFKYIKEKYAFWHDREDKLTTSLLIRNFRTKPACTMVKHGLVRRLRMLCHCMDRTFQHVAPDETAPGHDALLDASAYLQAFVVNVYGALDNLARIWTIEANLLWKGKPLPRGNIGLGPKFTTVRESLSKEMQEHLKSTDSWFEYLENYRHALAHRIPLYIPPRQLDEEAQAQWQALEHQKNSASKEHKYDLWNELLAKQMTLGIFVPLMMHSFGEEPEDATPVQFHGQMICDLATVIEVVELMLKELEALPK